MKKNTRNFYTNTHRHQKTPKSKTIIQKQKTSKVKNNAQTKKYETKIAKRTTEFILHCFPGHGACPYINITFEEERF